MPYLLYSMTKVTNALDKRLEYRTHPHSYGMLYDWIASWPYWFKFAFFFIGIGLLGTACAIIFPKILHDIKVVHDAKRKGIIK